MNPKIFFQREIIPIESGTIFAILSAASEKLYKDCIRKAAREMQFKCQSTLTESEESAASKIWEDIKKAELVIADVSSRDPEVMFQTGIALTIKDEENVLVLCKQNPEGEPSFKTDQFAVELYSDDLEKLTDKIRKLIQTIERKRKGTPELPNFKHLETHKLFESAVKARRSGDWETAHILFREANKREPAHWYLLTQWGVMYREKRDWEKAEGMFREAIDSTRYDEDKAHIYIEKAIMYQKADRIDDADSWFQKAQNTDNKNPKLYFAWAKFWDDIGNAQNALSKVVKILSDIDCRNQDAKNRMEYYTRKVTDPKYDKSFKVFMDEKIGARRGRRSTSGFKGHSRSNHKYREPAPNSLWNRPIEELIKYGPGQVVTGVVNNVVPFGVFLSFPQGHNGLIFRDDLDEGWQRRYFKGQRVKVKIKDIHKEPDGRLATFLIPNSRGSAFH